MGNENRRVPKSAKKKGAIGVTRKRAQTNLDTILKKLNNGRKNMREGNVRAPYKRRSHIRRRSHRRRRSYRRRRSSRRGGTASRN